MTASSTKRDLPGARLTAWLEQHVAGFRGPLAAVERFAGGQSNPSYRLDAASGQYVLRRKPPGPLLPSAHAVDREFRVIRALAVTAVPVPQVYALCEDDAVIGSAFYIMEYLDGRIFWDQRLPEIADPGQRTAMFEAMNGVIAALHGVDYEAVGLADFGRPGNYMGRQIARWSRQYRASETEPIAEMDRLIDWLPARLPPEGPASIVHGDYRMDNLIFHKIEPRVIGVLDWELSTIGDPLADFAYHVMCWRVTPQLFRGLAGIDFAASGIPDEAAYVTLYCRRTGREAIADLDFYMVYSLFRIAAICQGIAKRALDGTAASADAAAQGAIARPLAEQAWALAQSLGA
jgi:aminoglycoside phosphotransferase (APT) family kinase protein